MADVVSHFRSDALQLALCRDIMKDTARLHAAVGPAERVENSAQPQFAAVLCYEGRFHGNRGIEASSFAMTAW